MIATPTNQGENGHTSVRLPSQSFNLLNQKITAARMQRAGLLLILTSFIYLLWPPAECIPTTKPSVSFNLWCPSHTVLTQSLQIDTLDDSTTLLTRLQPVPVAAAVQQPALKGAALVINKIGQLEYEILPEDIPEDPVIAEMQLKTETRRRDANGAFTVIDKYTGTQLENDTMAMPKKTEKELIALGYAAMKKLNLVVAGVSRNNEKSFPNVFKRITDIGNLFRSYQVLVIENDSIDSTKKMLLEWADTNSNVHVHSYRFSMAESRKEGDTAAMRFQVLALLRNMYMAHMRRDEYDNADIVVVYDMDVGHPVSMQGIAHTFGLMVSGLPWEAACSNGVVPREWGRVFTSRINTEGMHEYALGRYFDSLAFRDKFFHNDNFRFHEGITHKPSDPAYYVDACFGGVAMYVKEALMHCSYDATDKCEHQAVNDCLRAHNYRILFNPRFMVHI
eukprot:comp8021_c0_seq1/m.3524 comp8021_c0_seq1/g.3524  ORF comp8021_c0_seq1/g.3524 comp8021_c0_seq1/m.3524 type:complete len:449 (-) comp8021_c0_seq1:451-1797(-)